jgi:hypothetical protein
MRRADGYPAVYRRRNESEAVKHALGGTPMTILAKHRHSVTGGYARGEETRAWPR